ncbi:hypothetical protein A3C89_03485 [Candidatus Kaiserbacteria bacterium RIFCSPHIGHO2_02_FULL_50_50]|uniref:Peptidase S49 domain-containing protein n=1 Tax=Candidatus Kaiserbacteria bacterium RIFCSPHIGHO2_02_FULL_50_50 TaxID=1798492 RepID=A0A1F6DD28_9BACT|nr:MAG: hypothetical protein A3C89_03485 [Candidatus Kaiserbacteria bacterium RIFCSPHIGHO2_02_FULL_50_50]OGG88523.1 MAG: hypothetical protein A3G62_03375 [Candidatus Kaiserbacteria bacterium RIFCSPLOWO2_12_FULL_50_10]
MTTFEKIGWTLGLSILFLALFSTSLIIWGNWNDEWNGYYAEAPLVSDGSCNIAVIPVMGEIGIGYTPEETVGEFVGADSVVADIALAASDPAIAGILLQIDSPGGTPVAAEIIASAIKNSELPTIALIREIGTSAGYLVASAADMILASPFSDVGSIGVTMSYLENVAQNEQDGLRYVPLTSAIYKDYGSPNKPLTTDERALLERDLKIYHDHFVALVAENRELSITEVAALADGSSMPGSLALEHKLIDRLGDKQTAQEIFAKHLEIPEDEVVFCE